MKPFSHNRFMAAVYVLTAMSLCAPAVSGAMNSAMDSAMDNQERHIASRPLGDKELAEENLPENLLAPETPTLVVYSDLEGLEFEMADENQKTRIKEVQPYDGEKYVLSMDAGRRRNVRCDIVISKDGYAPKSIEVSCTKRNPLAAYEVDYVDEMPKFLGGDKDSFAVWVSENMDYPEEALKQKHKGVIMVGFLVGKDGYLTDISLIRGLSAELDNETLKVVKSSPKWTPAMKDGEPVSMSFIMPVMFDIR